MIPLPYLLCWLSWTRRRAQVAPLEPRDQGRLSVYLCGPTVSGSPHLGHGRVNVIWDTLRRYLTWSGLEVRFVSNVTDIEDKIIARAAQEHSSTVEVAARYEALWWDTMAALGVERPDAAPHATAYVDDMVGTGGGPGRDRPRLSRAATASISRPSRCPATGCWPARTSDSLRAGARVEAEREAGKRSPLDFALWKLAAPGEPAWPSPWGPGRPGWHTECVVMSLDLLGEGFDLHLGGLDLAFPHHENERAQAVAAGKVFARRWAHNGMVVDERGEKMSKSVGNITSLPDLVERYDGRVPAGAGPAGALPLAHERQRRSARSGSGGRRPARQLRPGDQGRRPGRSRPAACWPVSGRGWTTISIRPAPWPSSSGPSGTPEPTRPCPGVGGRGEGVLRGGLRPSPVERRGAPRRRGGWRWSPSVTRHGPTGTGPPLTPSGPSCRRWGSSSKTGPWHGRAPGALAA